METTEVVISQENLEDYRADTFRSRPENHLKSADEAVEFVNQRGFILFWPAKGVVLPSLWVAVAGDRPVPDEHDDPGHITWSWKDGMLGKRKWFYSRVLYAKNTMISLEYLPYFYALSPNYGEPEADYLLEYEQGQMTLETRLVYEALLEKGPLDTLQLRKAARLSSIESTNRFNRALTDLQRKFRIMPTGISDSGAWHYSFIYDLVPRHFPDLIDRCRFVTESKARKSIMTCYFKSVGAASPRDVRKLFGWDLPDCETTLEALVKEGLLLTGKMGESPSAGAQPRQAMDRANSGAWFIWKDVHSRAPQASAHLEQ